ncbi:hypothetical protein GM921_07150 [Pedobacter sp. LMG 31464]|uniref:DUF5723 domain-containing protein n=1 Tax=Pedobacter planticolens TaxID=2679964 RepID=A0A923E0D7_9SPHI|nr:DUF5723 family protein [Pedobacter planticolens]MBB2145254.1 hypothetical protein [Pedobacter planticolens]
MKKKYILLVGFLFIISTLKAQQFALFNTKTQFDAFENPAAKSFTLDSSSKFASNFFLPNFSINAANKGDAAGVIRKSINENIYDTRALPLGTGNANAFYQNTNIYLLTFRIFSSYKYNQEVGFAWQVRSDSHIDYTNETLAIFDNYKRFDQGPYTDVFNNDGYQQSYHQFSVSIRENYNKRLAFGIKLSLLSGIAYNSLQINNSYFYADANDRLDIGVNGTYKGSFLYNDEISKKTFFPTFKNPGASISLGTTYTSKSGYFLMGNIKDLGLIRWSKSSYVANFNTIKSIYDVSTKSSSEINKEITAIAKDVVENKSFITPTNAKADFLISRTFNFYKPNLIVSKNLFYPGGDVALVNTFKINSLSASVTPVYNLNNFIMVGLQGMYQTPNFEFFLGTDNIGKTISLAKGLSKSDATIGSGYNGGSFYMGLGIKFGRTVNHPQNLSTMPGVNGEKVYKGVFRSLFNFFKKS